MVIRHTLTYRAIPDDGIHYRFRGPSNSLCDSFRHMLLRLPTLTGGSHHPIVGVPLDVHLAVLCVEGHYFARHDPTKCKYLIYFEEE